MHVARLASVRSTLVVCLLVSACQGTEEPPPSGGKRTGADEDTDALCEDGDDNDSDGYTDCQDPDCLNTPSVTVCRIAGGENTFLLCHDEIDNDSDGKADCVDPDCEFAGCFENTDDLCSDGINNDDDGGREYVDCDDYDCVNGCVVTVCSTTSEKTDADCTDGVDNDGDNKVDCEDFGCQGCVAACQAGLGENTLILCQDGDDNDDDSAADCQDEECIHVEGISGCDTGDENTDELCGDGVDNDNDPYVDCADKNCKGKADCVEDTAERCSDGLDNDGDRYADCLDWGCEDFEVCSTGGAGEATDELCSDGISNDTDDYVDCEDFDCKFGCAVTVCEGVEKSEAECTDDLDNDDDDHQDCDDQGCQECAPSCGGEGGGGGGGGGGGTPENTLELCEDGLDNDEDDAIDCRDVACVYVPHPACNTGESNCANGIDDDNDPWTDCADGDCWDDPACTENTNEKCSDLISNDGDNYIDCDDNQCKDNPAVTVCGPQAVENTDALCGDGLDNDNDGKTDCQDNDCKNNPALEVCPAALVTTIAAIQNPAHPDHVVIPSGQTRVRVKLTGVTVSSPLLTRADGKHVFFVQDAFPPDDTRWHGLEVYAGTAAPEILPGQKIDLVGFYTEFHGLSEVNFGKLSQAGTGGTVLPTEVGTQDLSTAELAEPYEGVLLKLDAVRVTAIGVESKGGDEPLNEDFSVVEASASGSLVPLTVATLFVPAAPAVDANYGFLVGPLTFTWEQFRLAPRLESDFGPPDASPDDDDEDGLTNTQEDLIGTSSQDPDTDGDGEDDLTEVVDPSLPADSDCDSLIDALELGNEDTDGDGTNDEVDWADHDGPDGDPDGDGVKNSEDDNDDGDNFCDQGIAAPLAGVCTQINDNCRTVANNTQTDSDGDAKGNACDADVDGDEVCNPALCLPVAGQCEELRDNCQFLSNDDQEDLDGDGVGDACDPDDDNDEVCDFGEFAPAVCNDLGGEGDNCERVANENQDDNDTDALGDVCDADDDNDGICDPTVQEGTQSCEYAAGETDNCHFEWNPEQEDTDGDGTGDACEVATALAVAGDFVVHEVLYDPPADDPETAALEGDANGDGARPDSYEDEFVELVNKSGHAVSIEGCRLKVKTTVKVTLTNTTAVPAKGGVLIFGGGNPTGSFGGSQVFEAPAVMQLGNDGSSVTFECPSGASGAFVTVATYTWSGTGGDPTNPNESLTRQTQGSSSASMVRHTTVQTGVPYSPGTCASGAALSTCF